MKNLNQTIEILQDSLEINSSSDLLYVFRGDFQTVSLSRRQNISKTAFLIARIHHAKEV